jgi:23S rRNA pseudouridine1911/1915/1917 synthase
MENTLNFIVSKEEASKRLDIFLTGKLTGLTRSGIKKLFSDDKVLVNGRPAKAGHKIRFDEGVSVTVPEPAPLTLKPEEMPLDILYEDDDVLVINKGAGIAVHPGAGRITGTLANAIISHTEDVSKIGGELRPGIVHRLDKDTTGVLVIAKTDPAHISLSKQFKDHTTARTYLALVWGTFKESEGSIDIPLGRDLTHRKKISPRTRKGRTALTHYRVLTSYPQMTLLEITPRTGRTHQIRAHLSAINHPVVGDQVYGRKKAAQGLPKALDEALKKVKRQFLHAQKLGFIHPVNGSYMEFTAAPPQDMDEILRLLKVLYS